MVFLLRFLRQPWCITLSRATLLFYLILICSLSLMSSNQLPSVEVNDKLQHVVAYAILSLLALLSFVNASKIKLALGCVMVGLLLEIGQSFVPRRFMDPWDLLANAIGIVIVIGLWSLIEHLYAEQLKIKH